MQKIYVNTTTRTWYNADGDQFADGFPRLAYKRSERFVIQLCSTTPDAGTPGVDPENNWPKDTQYGLPGVTALLSVDNDFLRRRKGGLASELAAGKVSQLVATISGASVATIRSAGTLRLFDSVGNMEGLRYTGYSISGETVTFTLAEDSELKNSYAAKSVMDIPDTLYMQAVMLIDESDPANGLFVFDLVAYTPKLRETMEYSNVSSLENLAGMELLIFTVNDVTTTECDSYLCTTCSVSATMAEADPDAQMPDTSADALIALIAAAIGYGYDRQFSVDGETNWHDEQADEDRYMRARLSVSGAAGAWLVWRLSTAETTDPVRRKVCCEANPRTLYLDSPVLVNSATNTAATLTFDFASFKVKPGGDSYTGQEGDDLTWVYRVTSSVNITSVTVGSVESTMEAIDVPADLPLLDGMNTVFVFVIHAIYDSSALNQLRMFVNYSHCYKAAL